MLNDSLFHIELHIDVDNGALPRIIEFVLGSLDDQSKINDLAGAKQIALPEPLKPDHLLAWLEPYDARFPGRAWTNRLKSLRPFTNTGLGGNLTGLYGY